MNREMQVEVEYREGNERTFKLFIHILSELFAECIREEAIEEYRKKNKNFKREITDAAGKNS